MRRGTAEEQGPKSDWYIDERSNPEKSTAAALKYLKLLNRMFDRYWHLTLASYNGGPGTVQRAVKRKGGQQDFWPRAESRRYLPRETREYVPMVLASMVIARNPEHYGFAFTPSGLLTTDKVTLPGPVDLRRVAEWADVSVDDVQRLNPELRRWTTPLRSSAFELAVPAGAGALVEQRLAESTAEEFTALQWHTVKKGETLQRHVFAEVDHFLLYDFFTSEGFVNEDVFAVSNRHHGERGLVIYHNKFAETAGWVKTSVGFMDKGSGAMVQRSLAVGLNLPQEGFAIFRDYITHLDYIRPCAELPSRASSSAWAPTSAMPSWTGASSAARGGHRSTTS